MRTGEVAQKMVRVGAEAMAEARRKEAERRKLRNSGQMIKNIRPARAIKEVMGALQLAVYSQGKDKKTGETNASKEYLDNYGYKDRAATHWVDSAERKGEPAAQSEMAKTWDEFLKGGN